MTSFLGAVNKLFDLLFWPFQSLPAICGLLASSVLTGVCLILVFRYTSHQQAIRRTKDKLQAYVLEVRLFQDQLGVVVRAYGRILLGTAAYLKLTLPPLAVLFVPITILLIQLDTRFGYQPFTACDQILLKAKVADPSDLDRIDLRLPNGLAVSAPPVRVIAEREITWRIAAQREGDYQAEVTLDDRSLTKLIRVGSHIEQLSLVRVGEGLVNEILDPAEAPLPKESRVESIGLNYPERSINLGLVSVHWLIPFFLFSIIAGFAVKGVFRAEF